MKAIVGLGNPGRQYVDTRHNIGFDVVNAIWQRRGQARWQTRYQAQVADVQVSGVRTLLICPTTYMNRSGQSVQQFADFYKIPLADMLVVCDDFQLPLGRLRIRPSGTAGGQRGLADILQRLGSTEIPRLRLGIGPVPDRWDPADFVLSRFPLSSATKCNRPSHERLKQQKFGPWRVSKQP